MEITNEMRQAFREEECGLRGHDLACVVTAAGDPSSVICERCGRSWKVAGERDR